MLNRITFTSKTMTLIFGIIVAIFLAISSFIVSQKEKKSIHTEEDTSTPVIKLEKQSVAISRLYQQVAKLKSRIK